MIRPAELTNLLTMIRASTAAMAEAIALLLHNPTEDKPMSKLSRHTLVAGAATLPALAGSVAAITPDPAVAAVELVQAAYKAIEDVMDEVPEDRRDTAWDTRMRQSCRPIAKRSGTWFKPSPRRGPAPSP
jgi:hypothetical protein